MCATTDTSRPVIDIFIKTTHPNDHFHRPIMPSSQDHGPCILTAIEGQIKYKPKEEARSPMNRPDDQLIEHLRNYLRFSACTSTIAPSCTLIYKFHCISCLSALNLSTMKPRIIIHGGAGNMNHDNLPPSLYAAYWASLLRILESSYSLLESTGADALTVAVHAVRMLEEE